MFADIQSYERINQGRMDRIGRNRNEYRQQTNTYKEGTNRKEQPGNTARRGTSQVHQQQ